MSDRLSALRLFIRVARSGNFSRGARDLGLSQPTASRMIAALEKDIGARLFLRSTRALALTEAGAAYLKHIEPALAAIEDAEAAARGDGQFSGTVRIAAASSFTQYVVIPRLGKFLKKHPKLRIELLVGDHRQDLVAESVDVAFRFGVLDDSSATARRLGSIERVLVASPAYLRSAGRRPKVPADLNSHTIVAGPMTGSGAQTFEKAGRQVSLRLESRIVSTANEAVVGAAAAGLGIALTGIIAARESLSSRKLVRVLPGWNLGSVDVHVVFPAGHGTKAAARELVEQMVGALTPGTES